MVPVLLTMLLAPMGQSRAGIIDYMPPWWYPYGGHHQWSVSEPFEDDELSRGPKWTKIEELYVGFHVNYSRSGPWRLWYSYGPPRYQRYNNTTNGAWAQYLGYYGGGGNLQWSTGGEVCLTPSDTGSWYISNSYSNGIGDEYGLHVSAYNSGGGDRVPATFVEVGSTQNFVRLVCVNTQQAKYLPYGYPIDADVTYWSRWDESHGIADDSGAVAIDLTPVTNKLEDILSLLTTWHNEWNGWFKTGQDNALVALNSIKNDLDEMVTPSDNKLQAVHNEAQSWGGWGPMAWKSGWVDNFKTGYGGGSLNSIDPTLLPQQDFPRPAGVANNVNGQWSWSFGPTAFAPVSSWTSAMRWWIGALVMGLTMWAVMSVIWRYGSRL